jgi:hypothetical protein
LTAWSSRYYYYYYYYYYYIIIIITIKHDSVASLPATPNIVILNAASL